MTTAATVLFGDTVDLNAIALGTTGDTIAETPIKWVTADSSRGTFADVTTGLFVAGNLRRD